MRKSVVLVFTPGYVPGYRYGGPIRTLTSLVDHLGAEYRFKVITSDRDFGQTEPYSGVTPRAWQDVGAAEVYYASRRCLALLRLQHLIHEARPDVVYLNSFFSPDFTIRPLLLRRLGRLRGVPFIVAPRNELSPAALALKSRKKQVYLGAARAVGLYNGVIWQASSSAEAQQIRMQFGVRVPIIVAPNLTPQVAIEANPRRVAPHKRKGILRVLFLSRIAPIKNLAGALEMLNGVSGRVEFNIFGPREDEAYWKRCESIIQRLPSNIRVEYHGPVPNERVQEIMADHHLLLHPSLSENFGHVIAEALRAGCPVLISDCTPWRRLKEQGVGWDLPLNRPTEFRAVIERLIEMDREEYLALSGRARDYGVAVSRDEPRVARNRQLFGAALGTGRAGRDSPDALDAYSHTAIGDG